MMVITIISNSAHTSTNLIAVATLNYQKPIAFSTFLSMKTLSSLLHHQKKLASVFK
jgi:hypothetical protein